jgi:hypothetical protein
MNSEIMINKKSRRRFLLGAVEDPLGSAHSLGEAVIAPGDDGTCKLHQTYNLQSLCSICILVDQVSQEIHSLSAVHTEVQETNWICRVIPFPDYQHCLHLVEKFHSTVELLETAVYSRKMKQVAFGP